MAFEALPDPAPNHLLYFRPHHSLHIQNLELCSSSVSIPRKIFLPEDSALAAPSAWSAFPQMVTSGSSSQSPCCVSKRAPLTHLLEAASYHPHSPSAASQFLIIPEVSLFLFFETIARLETP